MIDRHAAAGGGVILSRGRPSRDIVMRSNLCSGSGENGIHAGADGLVIEGNIIRNPVLYGIIVLHKPYDQPDPCKQVLIAQNVISFADPESRDARGIGLRNCLGFNVLGNQIQHFHLGIEVLSHGATARSGPGIIGQNLLTDGGAMALRLRAADATITVQGNHWQAARFRDPADPLTPGIHILQNPAS